MADLPTVVCYGDSNTYGYDAATGGHHRRDVRWPSVASEALAGRAHVVEEGLNGRTTIWDDPFGVAVVVILLGTSDLKTIFRVDAPAIASGARALADMARTSGTGPAGGQPAVLLVAPPPLGPATDHSDLWGFGSGRDSSTRLGPLCRLAAELAGASFLEAGALVGADPSDGVHLDPAAHGALGRAIAAAVDDILAGDGRQGR